MLQLRLQMMDKGISSLLAETIFDAAREDFKKGDPDGVRARGRNPNQPFPLMS